MAKQQHITKYLKHNVGNPFMTSNVSPLRNEEEGIPDPNILWSGGSADSEWKDVRFAALARDHYRCTNPDCGSTQNLDVHHIIPKAQRSDAIWKLDNFITPREKCHIVMHKQCKTNHGQTGDYH
jgi:hypothetical protein